MKIALDYDNTYSVDPVFWNKFISMAIRHGHEVKIVTSRHPSCTVPLGHIDIVYCAFKAKRSCYQADVWIDDDPKYVDQDHPRHIA